jgi:arylsulfatase A-like enzyme
MHRMHVRRCLPLALALLVPACAEGASDPRPNVLLISLDSVRRDMLGCYGASFAGRSPSPSLDRLAAAGVRVEDALSSTSWTLPAHATLFTGAPELVHGLEQDGQRLPDSLPTLAERLRDAGYRTAGVYSGPYLDPRFGLGRGFERYRAGYGPELAAATRDAAEALERVHALGDSTPREESYPVLERNAEIELALQAASQGDSSSRAVTELVLAELAATDGDARPFFLFAHYFDPHYDYVPPPPFDRALDPGYAGTVDGRDFAARIAAPAASPADLAHLRALHAGELAWTDSEIGRVLEELERRELAANTLVVVVSDHGDEFLEHGGFGHRRTLHEEVVRVPLILRWPRALPAGEVQSGPSSLAGVAPTILALVAGEPGRAPLLAPAEAELVLGRLIANPTGRREDVRVIESFRHGGIKLLRERSLDPAATDRLRWLDLARHPDERDVDWSSDLGDPAVQAALAAFREHYVRLVNLRHDAPPTAKTEDLLAAFRGLGYPGEEARVGALADEDLVLPPIGGWTADDDR